MDQALGREAAVAYDHPLTFRVPPELISELDALVEAFSADPAYRGMKVTRSILARMALEAGVSVLRARSATVQPPAEPPPKPKRTPK
jgi:hypothetical protein